MSFKKLLFSAVLFLALNPCANAITIGGKDFTKILEVSANNSLGYWSSGTYFTFRNYDDNHGMEAIDAYKVGSADAIFQNNFVYRVAAMGMTNNNGQSSVSSGAYNITSGVLNLYGANNQLLISAVVASNGVVDIVKKSGFAGQENVSAIYNITGGSLFQSGSLTGQLYIDMAFNHVWSNKTHDLKTNLGSINFYRAVCAPQGCGGTTGGGSTGSQIPEPATVTLLGTSLLGLLRKKSKK